MFISWIMLMPHDARIVTRALGSYKWIEEGEGRIGGRCHTHAVFAGFFCHINGGVGCDYEIGWGGGVNGERRDADTTGERTGLAVEGCQFRQHRQGGDAKAKPLGRTERTFHRCVRKDKRKLLSAIPGGKVAGSCDAAARSLLAVQEPA